MLKVFRRKGVAKKVLWVIAVLIIISFAFGFGVSRYANTDHLSAPAGKIFGQKISVKEFRAYSLAVRDQAMMTAGQNYEKILPYIDMDNETWTRILLVKEANRRGIKVMDREVIASIRSIPSFQRDGDFDKTLYASILAHVFRRDAREFEEAIRDQIRIARLLQSSVGRINIPEDKIREEYEKRNRKIQVGYVLVDPKPFAKDLPVTDADLPAYYEKHREEFLKPDEINIQYINLPLNEKSPLEEHAKAQKTADAIYQKASGNSDLAAAAKENNLAVQETGFFNMEEPNLSAGWSWEILSQAFKAKTGAILPPSVTPGGIAIIKVTDRKPAHIPTFDQAKEQVKEKLLAEKATGLARQKAEEFRSALAKTTAEGKNDFAAAARSAGFTPKETPFFIMGDYIPEIGLSEDFQTAAAATSEKSPLSDIIQTLKGPVILWYQATQTIDDKKFEEIKNDFTLTLYKEEQSKAVSAVVQDIRAKAKLESYLDKIRQKSKDDKN